MRGAQWVIVSSYGVSWVWRLRRRCGDIAARMVERMVWSSTSALTNVAVVLLGMGRVLPKSCLLSRSVVGGGIAAARRQVWEPPWMQLVNEDSLHEQRKMEEGEIRSYWGV